MKGMDIEMQQWIALHTDDDTMRLRLRHRGDEDILNAILQIECRRKAATRMPLAISSPSFLFPTSLSAEQATSEPLARIHADIADYKDGSLHLDLTSGLAIDAFEAARRRAHVTAIDIDHEMASAVEHNASALNLSHLITALTADSQQYIADTDNHWDSIFIDPARRGDNGRRLTAIAECRPDVTSMLQQMLAIAPKIIIKASPMLDMTALATELNTAAGTSGSVSRMVAIGTTRECKEIVAIVERHHSGLFSQDAITLLPGEQEERVVFVSKREISTGKMNIGIPHNGDYLYEPYPAVMKVSAWEQLASLNPSLFQLNANTHLFASAKKVAGFPGIEFIIESILPMNKRKLKSLASDYPTVNVSVRNFVISAPELAKRMKIKEGGTLRLYGARCGYEGDPMLIVCRQAL